MRIKSFFTGCLLMATLLVSNQDLSAGMDWGCCERPCQPCCEPTCCEPEACCDNTWSVTVNGGVVPTWFLRRSSNNYFFRPIDSLVGDDFPFTGASNRFHDQWDHPWTVGVEIGYMYCCNWEAFFDFSYLQAEGRCCTNLATPRGLSFNTRAHEFRSYEYYLGTRYYFDPYFCYFTPFVGGKVGLVQRNGASVRETIGVGIVDTIFDGDRIFKNTTTVGGGFHIGVNCDLTCNLALSFKVEALFTGDWAHDRIDNISPFPIIVLGSTGPILEVPITLGLRYTF